MLKQHGMARRWKHFRKCFATGCPELNCVNLELSKNVFNFISITIKHFLLPCLVWRFIGPRGCILLVDSAR
jgi:hypothetical protein